MKPTSILGLLLALLVLASCGGNGSKTAEGTDTTEQTATDEQAATEEDPGPEVDEVLPPGGSVPDIEGLALEEAAGAAGCELKSFKGRSRLHTDDEDEEIDYPSSPPTSGKHLGIPAEDAAYISAPDEKALVHSLEHGRVVVWFKADLPDEARASLRAFYENDPSQTLLTPDETGSDYEVSATAWNRAPRPNGTGRLLGCKRYTPKVFEAVEAFRNKHRGRGPEAIP